MVTLRVTKTTYPSHGRYTDPLEHASETLPQRRLTANTSAVTNHDWDSRWLLCRALLL